MTDEVNNHIKSAIHFCYHLQGFVEIFGETPTDAQWQIIKIKAMQVELVGDMSGNQMSAEDFVVWLSGFITITDADSVTEVQWEIIKEHLQLVFHKVTGQDNNYFGLTMEEVERALQVPGSTSNLPTNNFCTNGVHSVKLKHDDLICARSNNEHVND